MSLLEKNLTIFDIQQGVLYAEKQLGKNLCTYIYVHILRKSHQRRRLSIQRELF